LATPFRTVKGLVWAQNRRTRPATPPFTATHKGLFGKTGRFSPGKKIGDAAPQQGNKTMVDEERRLPTWHMKARAT
jgi:hypothetical protein